MARQVQVLKLATRRGKTECRVLTRDRDQKLGKAFAGPRRNKRITPIRLPHCAPNLDAHVERFIQTLQVECLDRFTLMGTSHLDHIAGEFIDYYNRQRPHSLLELATPADGSRPPALGSRKPAKSAAGTASAMCSKHYYRMAA